MDWETYVQNLSELGPRKLKSPPVTQKAKQKQPANPSQPQVLAAPSQVETGRIFYAEEELVRDSRPWSMPGEEWVMNGNRGDESIPKEALREEILRRVLDPLLHEDEALAVLLAPRQRLRDAVNQGRLAMFRNLAGERFFRLNEILELAAVLNQEKT